ncbi:MAG: MBL fold metallo-hydrolase, partial [Candidatus Colwellbacteria bacterium]|nr:MBL fold metallo-hydrolase [Candidatus Colwellbacteria bacterium]
MRLALLLSLLALSNFLLWGEIGALSAASRERALYFLNVGEGDGSFARIEGASLLVDGGPGAKAVYELEKVLRPMERRIDVVMLSHPNRDHYEGLIEVSKRYRVGVFVASARESDDDSFHELMATLRERNIRVVRLSAGDRLRYKGNILEILSPTKELLRDRADNNASLVVRAEIGDLSALLTGDIEKKAETTLGKMYGDGLKSEILKVAHHGSRYSSSERFLEYARPS